MIPFHRALLHTMNGMVTYKTTTSAEEQISIVRRKSRHSIEGVTIDGNQNRSGENRAFIESIPMGIVKSDMFN
jgi:hypothetical protein